MGILDFIFGIIVVVIVTIIVIGYISMKYNVSDLEKKNERLHNELIKARQKKVKETKKK